MLGSSCRETLRELDWPVDPVSENRLRTGPARSNRSLSTPWWQRKSGPAALKQLCVGIDPYLFPFFRSSVGPIDSHRLDLSGLTQPDQHPGVVGGGVAAVRVDPTPQVRALG